MAQIIGDKLLMFRASAIDANTVANADDGTDLDLACFPASNISSIVAEQGKVYIYFTNANKYDVGTLSGDDEEAFMQAMVRLTCTNGTEHKVIEDLWSMMNSVSAPSVIKFDFVTTDYVCR